MYIYHIYHLYMNIFNMFLLWHQTLCGPMPDVGVDLVLPEHPLPQIFDSHLAPCQVKNVEHHTLSTVPRTGGRTKESAYKLVVTNIPWISMIPLSKELLNHWHGTRTNSKWNEPSMHCQAENLSPYVRHGRMFHVIQVYPGCWSPPFKKTIEYYASFTHCHIVLYNDTRVYDSVNIWTRTNTYVY